MPSEDSIVAAHSIDMIRRWIEQHGVQAALERLEEIEPAIGAFAGSEALHIGRDLSLHDLPNRAVELFTGRILLALLTCIEATRQAGRRLWEDMLPEGIDPEESPF